MATKQPTQLCYQVNGGTCRNKVSKEKGYVCSAGHRPGANQVAPIAIASIQQVPPKVDLSKMKVAEKLELAKNESLNEDIQRILAEDKDKDVRRALAENPSLTLPVSIALAEQGYAPYGFARSKSTEELWAHKNLIMTGDYQSQFGEAFLNRLVNLNYTKPEDKIGQLAEQRKLLILLAFYKYAGAEGEGKNEISGYRDKILNIFPDDQEIAYLIST